MIPLMIIHSLRPETSSGATGGAGAGAGAGAEAWSPLIDCAEESLRTSISFSLCSGEDSRGEELADIVYACSSVRQVRSRDDRAEVFGI